MTIYSCYTGSEYELFSSKEAAESRAKSVKEDFKKQNHPLGFEFLYLSVMIEEGPVTYWHKPAHTREETIGNSICTFHVGFQESMPCVAGDDSPEVAAAVAQWWDQRDAAWNALA